MQERKKDQSPIDETNKDTTSQGMEQEKNYVRITKDKMEAWLYLTPPKDASDYTKADLISIIEANNVKVGLISSNIAAMAKKRIYHREVKVADGIPCREGSDGTYEYFLDTRDYSKSPKINENGTVDYQSMSLLQNVKKDDVLAIYHNLDKGEPGFDVCGNKIMPMPVKELKPLVGKGISNKKEANKYIAEMDGKVSLKNGRMEIQSVHEISGDVDSIMGRVEFNGDIVINGNVGPGIVIKAGRTLTITGTVEAVNIEAGGDVILKRGIQGNEKAIIVSKGNVFADFIEHSEVRAEGNVCSNIILNSRIVADGKVILTGKKGTVLGGDVHGLLGIEASCIGNDVEIKTLLHAGCEPEVFNQKLIIQKKEADFNERFEVFSEDFKVILKQRKISGASPMQELKIKQFLEKKEALEIEKEELDNQQKANSEMIEKGKDSTIRADGNIFRGSIICINNSQMMIERSTCYMEYRSVAGAIVGTVIVKN
ncbi:MAG TPA: FapA family protein [Lachnospiraceae bacterium]|nr:FapA family protein [Lachnospiraceae bacterium]